MGEVQLNYNRSVVPQDTGYWCGPASAQIVLNARGINVSEAELARKLGTTTAGTNYVGLIERVLNEYLPDADYTSVYLEKDPPTRAQRDALWANLQKSIAAGYGVVMNWVSPPGNRPRGVKGSISPNYGINTVWHYVTAMGVDTDQMAVWIADSGFSPQGYWISLDQCATLIPPKGYCYANPRVKSPTATTTSPALTVLRQAVSPTTLNDSRLAELLPRVARALDLCGCTTPRRRAMWFAQVGHESGGLRYQEEIASGQSYENRADLGNIQIGDGARFKGRDFIQVTGRRNYTELSRWAHAQKLVPTSTFFVDNPQALATDEYAFVGTTWYWTTQRPLNDAADAGDIERATRLVNGGLNGLADRKARYNTAMSLGDLLMKISSDTPTRVESPVTAELHPSRSPYREDNKPIMSALDAILNIDAMCHAGLIVEPAALRGELWAIEKVARLANGDGPGSKLWWDATKPDEWAVSKAQFLLQIIEQTNPGALLEYLASKEKK